MRGPVRTLVVTSALALWPLVAAAQQPPSGNPPPPRPIDQELATAYFREAATLCEREGGRLWGVSLCGPIVFADAVTKSIATSHPAPDAPRPAMLGFANTALDWGGTRWTTVVWRMIPATDSIARRRLIIHEMFHRIQPQLGLFLAEPNNEHLETLDGRYWLQLEWRALAEALGASGPARLQAIADALAFRAARHGRFGPAATNERVLEINEGLAQYTGTVVSAGTSDAAVASAIAQLRAAPREQTFVRTFAYASGAAYGVLLDAYAPGWTRRLTPSDDLAQLLATAAGVSGTGTASAAGDADVAARRYDGAALRSAEERLEAERQARLADYRRRFVDGPVLIIPRPGSASFVTNGLTPIPGVGTVYPTYRATGPWGSLEGDLVLVGPETLSVPAPAGTEGARLTGNGWTLTLAEGWVARPARRTGDFEIVRAAPPPDADSASATSTGGDLNGGTRLRR